MSVTVHLPNCVVNALNHSVIESIASFNQPGKLPAFSSKSMMKTVDSLIIAGAFSIKLLICCIIGGPTIEIAAQTRSEEHTSELQSRGHLVCRLLRENKKECIPYGQRRYSDGRWRNRCMRNC